MEQEDRIEIYTLPPNFAEEGTVLSGRFKTRNVVETAIILGILVPMIAMLPVTLKGKLYIGMIVLIPITIFCVLGIQGQSLFAFISSFFVYVRRRRILMVPDERYRLEQNRRRERKKGGGGDDRAGTKNGKSEMAQRAKEGKAGHKKRAPWFGSKDKDQKG